MNHQCDVIRTHDWIDGLYIYMCDVKSRLHVRALGRTLVGPTAPHRKETKTAEPPHTPCAMARPSSGMARKEKRPARTNSIPATIPALCCILEYGYATQRRTAIKPKTKYINQNELPMLAYVHTHKSPRVPMWRARARAHAGLKTACILDVKVCAMP